MPKNITIAKLNTIVAANAEPFVAELTRAGRVSKEKGNVIRRSMNDIKNSIGGSFRGSITGLAAGFTVGGIASYGKSLLELGDDIQDLSEQAGMAPRAFQVLSAVATENGMKMEDVARASEHLRSKLQDAVANGADPFNEGLKKLHLSAAGLQGLRPEEMWEVLGRHLAAAANKQEAFNTLSDAFGDKIGPKMRGVLTEIAKGYEEVAKKKEGMIFTDDEINELAKANKFWSRAGMIANVNTVKFVKWYSEMSAANPMLGTAARAYASIKGMFSKDVPYSDLKPAEGSAPGESGAQNLTLEQKMKDAEKNSAVQKLNDLFSSGKDTFSEVSSKQMLDSLMNPEELQKRLLKGGDFPKDIQTDTLARVGGITGALRPEGDRATERLSKTAKETNDILRQILQEAKRSGRGFDN
jgi:hypothetical protein